MFQASLSIPDLPGIGEGWELLLPPAERARRCTGETAVKSEQKREAILCALTRFGTRQVADSFGVSREVVRALRAEAIREGKLDQVKEMMGRRYLSLADSLMDRVEENIDKVPLNMAVLASVQAADKGLLLTGQPTARIEHAVNFSHGDINDMIDALPVSVTPVLSGEIAQQKGSAPDLAGRPALPAPAPSAEPPRGDSGDVQSLVSAQLPRETDPTWAKDGQNNAEKGGAR